MKKFWRINFVIAAILFLLFFIIYFTVLYDLDSNNYFYQVEILFALMCLSTLQSITCLIISLVKFKKQSYQTIFILIYLFTATFVQIIGTSIFLGFIGRFLGDI